MGDTVHARCDSRPHPRPGVGTWWNARVATVGFDLDLTLCDTRPGIVAAFAALAAESGVAVDGELIVTRLGPKLETELANWFPEERITEAAAIYRHHYATTCLHGTTALPGATELLERLVRSGHDIVVVTAKSEALARVCLDVAGLHEIGRAHV